MGDVTQFSPPAAGTVIRAGALQTVKATIIIPPKSPADLSHRYILAKWSGANNPTSTSTVLLPDGSLLTAFTSGYLSRPEPKGTGPADAGGRQVCLIRWRP
jgi:hypothetical protein